MTHDDGADTAPELLRANLDLLLEVTEGDRIGERAGEEPEEAPRVLVSRLADRFLVFCHRRLSSETVARLRAADPARLWDDPGSVRAILEKDRALARPWLDRGLPIEGLFFAVDPGAPTDPAVEERDRGFEIRVGGRVAARAYSVRQSPRAAELAVRTEPEFRRRGWATRVARAWAHAVVASGRAAFYTYTQGNEESHRLAERLGVRWYASTVAYY